MLYFVQKYIFFSYNYTYINLNKFDFCIHWLNLLT